MDPNAEPCWFLVRTISHQPSAMSQRGFMRLSIRENMVPGATLLEKFRNLRQLGFDGIEITTSSSLEQADEIQAAMKETGIQPSITSTRGGGCLIDPRKEERDMAVKGHVEALELAAR